MTLSNYGSNFRAQKVDVHKFSMVPHHQIPRSTFRQQHTHKTTFNASLLIPIYVQEILPGDTINLKMTAYARIATLLYPLMDQMDIETWFFFVPNRILWSHWVNFMGEQPATPSDSINYSIPQIVSPAGGFVAFSVYDYFGLPTAGQIQPTFTTSVNALPFRAYNIIYNQWFRDQNIISAAGTGATNTVGDIGDGPDPATNYSILVAAKRHDYFTACLPWAQKGGVAVTLPLGTSATVKTTNVNLFTGTQFGLNMLTTAGANPNPTGVWAGGPSAGATAQAVSQYPTGNPSLTGTAVGGYPANLYADLSTATAATINQIRLAFQTQRLLERDARGGTRYQELVFNHFKVMGHDSRYQRPEYQGGGKTPINVTPVPQTNSATVTGNNTPMGQLAGVGLAVAHGHGFRGSYTEHGYIIGLCAVRRENQYQQGTRRLWTRLTRYDFYWPVFANLGEQAVRNDEIYTVGNQVAGQDAAAFGFQEHWSEYRYQVSFTTGAFRSTYATPLDAWHLATKFASLPTLNTTFISDDTNTTLARAIASGPQGANEQIIADLFFDVTMARPMPLYSVPGLIDHF